MRREIQAAALRRHDRRNDAVFLAWQVERIRIQTRRGKTSVRIVSLDTVLLPEPGSLTGPTVPELRATLHALAAKFGGRVRKAPKAKKGKKKSRTGRG